MEKDLLNHFIPVLLFLKLDSNFDFFAEKDLQSFFYIYYSNGQDKPIISSISVQ